MKRQICFALIFCLLSSCAYHYERKLSEPVVISVPYIKGDREGTLNAQIVKALSASGMFECIHENAEYVLEVAILSDSDSRIGYRYDRNPTSGKLRKNIVGTENRQVLVAEVKVLNSYTQEIILGPQTVKGFSEYDYVDSNSIRDLTFITTDGVAERVLDFSLGQLDSIEGAHDDGLSVAYLDLTDKIVSGVIATVFSQSKK